MKKIPVNEIREHLSKYLSEAERGEQIIITKHSRPVAQLLPVTQEKSELPDLQEFRNSIKIKGKPMSEVVTDERNESRY